MKYKNIPKVNCDTKFEKCKTVSHTTLQIEGFFFKITSFAEV